MKKINICHLYGNLLNTYGDVGNVMAISHEAHKNGYEVNTDIVTIGDDFNPNNYDFVFFGGGQDYEQSIVQGDLVKKSDSLREFIEKDGVLLAICGGFQLLGKYYYDAYNNKIDGLAIFSHYTKNQEDNKRFTGPIKIKDSISGDIYEGFENHGGVTFLADDQNPFAIVIEGNGNNGTDKTEGFRYKNTIGTYLHGPILARNEVLCSNLFKLIEKNTNFS